MRRAPTHAAETVPADDGTRSVTGSIAATMDAASSAPPSPRQLYPGAVVNERYTIEQLLGHGGMGMVYRASDALHPTRELALKTIFGGATRRARISMFKSEFRTMSRLRHPNVARVYDFEPITLAAPLRDSPTRAESPGAAALGRGRPAGESDDYLFTMELVDGRDAFDATEHDPWTRVIERLVDVLRGLSYVHSRKIVHFDLKPANVMVDREGCVKILDFGIAGAAFGPGGVKGTPHYMAPELTREQAQIDHRADLYSLGIMAYELLCRRLPFEGGSLFALVSAHHQQPLRFHERDEAALPAWLRDLVSRLCSKAPDERFRSANAVIEAINRGGGTTYELETKETRESYALSSRFVGREDEHDRLWSFVRAGTDGAESKERALFVSGQSGVGKSRLMRELRGTCQLHRVPFIEVDCHENGLSDLEPIVRALSFAVPLARSVGRVDLLDRYGPQLAKLAPESLPAVRPAPAHPDPEREPVAVREAVASFLLAVAAQTPYALYCNDLQWAGPGTIDVLRRLAADHGDARLALLGTFRDDEVAGRPLEALVTEDVEVLPLRPLVPEEIDVVMRSMLGVDQLPDAFVERMAESTSGNPFFVEELMRALIENGHVYLEAGAWAASQEIAELPIPTRMDEVFRRRASMLGEAERRVLEACAVHGKPVDADVLAAACGIEPEALFDALAVLRQRSMIRAGDDTAFATAHDRIRETTYGEMSADARREMHARLAEALEAGEPPHGERLTDVANHWRQGCAPDDPDARKRHVAQVLRSAAVEAQRTTLYEASRTYLELASELVASVDPRDTTGDALRREIRGELLAVLYLVDWSAGEARYAAVLATIESPAEEAVLHRIRTHALWMRGRYHAAHDCALDALARFGHPCPRRPSIVRALFELTWTLFALRRRSPADLAALPEASDPRVRACLAVMEAGGPASTYVGPAASLTTIARMTRLVLTHGVTADAAVILMGLAVVMQSVLGNLRRGWELGQATLALAERFGNPRGAGTAHAGIGAFTAVWCVPLADALVMVRRGIALCFEQKEMGMAGALTNVSLTIGAWQAPTAEAWRAAVREHEGLFASLGDPHTLAELRAVERVACDLAGGVPSTLAIEDPSLSDEGLAAMVDDPMANTLIHCCESVRHASKGRWREAAAAGEQAMALIPRSPVRQYFTAQAELVWFVSTTRAGLARGLSLRLWRSLRRFDRFARSCPENFEHMRCLMRAEHARLRGRHAEAEAHYERAIELATARGYVLNAALAEQLAAKFFADRGEPERAAELDAAARDRYARWSGAHP